MDRTDIIQQVIDRTGAHRYLEIGVFDGGHFFRIWARRKVAVDPQFVFSQRDRVRWWFKNPTNVFARFHEKTSDAFFSELSPTEKFDVIFVDGLHTYSQALRDAENALTRLTASGTLILHDCNPPHEAAALPAQSIDAARSANVAGWTDEWCGDVWKAVCHLRSQRRDLSAFVLDCDYGVGVVRFGTPAASLQVSAEDIAAMTYHDLEADRRRLLNLQDPAYLTEFLNAL